MDYVTHWVKTMRTYNETAREKFSDFRQCEMLNNALQGNSMGVVAQVWNSATAARTAAGNSDPLDFNSFYSMVLNAVSAHESSKGTRRRGFNSVNMTELVFEDGHSCLLYTSPSPRD